MNIRRGFHRVAWVLTAISVLPIGMVAYESSTHVDHFEAELIHSEWPKPDDATRLVAIVEDVGLFYFPSYTPRSEMDANMPSLVHGAASSQLPGSDRLMSIKNFAASVRAKYPEYTDLSDVDLTKRVVTKYPVYRSSVNFREYDVKPIYARRPIWAAGITVGSVAVVALCLHGLVALLGWIAAGFSERTV